MGLGTLGFAVLFPDTFGNVFETVTSPFTKIFGDLLGGPTKVDRDPESTNRGEALRKLLNRVRFSSEGLLITPFVYGVGRGAKELATRGKDLAYSDSRFLRPCI